MPHPTPTHTLTPANALGLLVARARACLAEAKRTTGTVIAIVTPLDRAHEKIARLRRENARLRQNTERASEELQHPRNVNTTRTLNIALGNLEVSGIKRPPGVGDRCHVRTPHAVREMRRLMPEDDVKRAIEGAS